MDSALDEHSLRQIAAAVQGMDASALITHLYCTDLEAIMLQVYLYRSIAISV